MNTTYECFRNLYNCVRKENMKKNYYQDANPYLKTKIMLAGVSIQKNEYHYFFLHCYFEESLMHLLTYLKFNNKRQ